jgi:hypothetical protein
MLKYALKLYPDSSALFSCAGREGARLEEETDVLGK